MSSRTFATCPSCNRKTQVGTTASFPCDHCGKSLVLSQDYFTDALNSYSRPRKQKDMGIARVSTSLVNEFIASHNYSEIHTPIAAVEQQLFGGEDVAEVYEAACSHACSSFVRITIPKQDVETCTKGETEHHFHAHQEETHSECWNSTVVRCCWCGLEAKIDRSSSKFDATSFSMLLREGLLHDLDPAYLSRFEELGISQLAKSSLDMLETILKDVVLWHRGLGRELPLRMKTSSPKYVQTLGKSRKHTQLLLRMLGFELQWESGVERIVSPSSLSVDEHENYLRALACIASARQGLGHQVDSASYMESYSKFHELLGGRQYVDMSTNEALKKLGLGVYASDILIADVARCLWQYTADAQMALMTLAQTSPYLDQALLSMVCEGDATCENTLPSPRLPETPTGATGFLEFAASKIEDKGSELREEGSAAGLINDFATCYLNSLLQLCFHMPRFSDVLFSYSFPPDKEVHEPKMKFVLELQTLYGFLARGARSAYSPTTVLERLLQVQDAANHKRYQQEDVHEYFGLFLDVLDDAFEECPPSPSSLFKATIKDEVRTLFSDGREQTTSESNPHFLVTIPVKDSLKEALSSWSTEQMLDGDYRPEGAHGAGESTTTKLQSFEALPAYLTFHVQRVMFAGGCVGRNSAPMAFPDELHMDPWLSDNAARYAELREAEETLIRKREAAQVALDKRYTAANLSEIDLLTVLLNAMVERGASQEQTQALQGALNRVTVLMSELEAEIELYSAQLASLYDVQDLQDHLYRLHSVIIHQGSSATVGHYYCFLRQRDGTWLKFDDAKVSPVSFDTVKRVANGEADGSSGGAYLVGYAKEGTETGRSLDVPRTIHELVDRSNANMSK